MSTKLTVIVDNIPHGGMRSEWGLSILAEYKDKKILVDAGASSLFLENMKKLGINVKDIDFDVLPNAFIFKANNGDGKGSNVFKPCADSH